MNDLIKTGLTKTMATTRFTCGRLVLALVSILVFVTALSAQGVPVRVRVLYDKTDATSSAVAPLLIHKIGAQPKLFAMVESAERNLSVIIECHHIASLNQSYSCFYVANRWRGSSEAFLGGAGIVTKSAEDAANALFASLLLVMDRWNTTDRQMQIAELESCLALAENSCAVPESLVPELKVKSINLSEYYHIGGLEP